MKRTRAYRRSEAKTHIARKKGISRHIYFFDWYDNDNQYSKNKVHCSCWMCRGYNEYLDTLRKQKEADETKEDFGAME